VPRYSDSLAIQYAEKLMDNRNQNADDENDHTFDGDMDQSCLYDDFESQ
jgi:hypothetical protein